jgi:RNA polymerase sigma-70 factor (family 1)
LLPAATIQELQKRIALYEDSKAYKELYDLLFDGLHRFSFSFVKSNEAAEEIVSDVYIKIWQIRGRLTEIDNLKVYMYTITKNFSLNYIARNYKNPATSLDNIEVEAVVGISNPEELCISAETIKVIKEVIRELPPQCKLVFQLVKEDGLSYKDAAAVLNLSVLTVRNQLAIAIRKIAAALPAYMLSSVKELNKFSAS